MDIRYTNLRFPHGKGKAVTLSYDDGFKSDIKFAEIINQYGLKCTFNLCGKSFGRNGLTDDEIKDNFISKGHEIAVHGFMHRAPGKHRPIEVIQDVLNCRLELEKRFDTIVKGMAYPDSGITQIFGKNTYDNIKQYLTNLDIVYARTLGQDNDLFELPTDWHAWMPTCHHINPSIFSFINKFLSHDVSDRYIADREPKLFYMWGHSYEFDANKNWDLLEKICENLAGHNDIWYATNMEIYNYVSAYNSLSFSADSTRVFNPTLLTVWFEINGNTYEIKSGETIKISV